MYVECLNAEENTLARDVFSTQYFLLAFNTANHIFDELIIKEQEKQKMVLPS